MTDVERASKRQSQRDNNRCKKNVKKQVKGNIEFLKHLGWFEEEQKKRTCLQTLHIQ